MWRAWMDPNPAHKVPGDPPAWFPAPTTQRRGRKPPRRHQRRRPGLAGFGAFTNVILPLRIAGTRGQFATMPPDGSSLSGLRGSGADQSARPPTRSVVRDGPLLIKRTARFRPERWHQATPGPRQPR